MYRRRHLYEVRYVPPLASFVVDLFFYRVDLFWVSPRTVNSISAGLPVIRNLKNSRIFFYAKITAVIGFEFFNDGIIATFGSS
jgi:hypothetical protein